MLTGDGRVFITANCSSLLSSFAKIKLFACITFFIFLNIVSINDVYICYNNHQVMVMKGCS